MLAPACPSPFRIAIVGGGFAGSMTATQVLHGWRGGPLRLTLLERGGDHGPGVAFSTPDDAHLLNVVAGGMSALPDVPPDFVAWLRREDPDAHAGTYAPRRSYGRYLRARLAEAERARRCDVAFERRTAEAVRVHASRRAGAGGDDGPAAVELADGERIAADVVVLAVGVNRPRMPSGADRALLDAPGWVGDPWDHARIAALTDAERVLVLGTGLTMVDVALSLAAAGVTPRGGALSAGGRAAAAARGGGPRLIALSRRGVLPHAHRATPPAHSAPYRPPLGPLTADRLAAHVETAALAEIAAGGDWRTVVDGVRPYTQSLWQALPLGEQARFLARHARRWEIHRHRMAPAVAARVRALRDAGRLEIRAGSVLRVEPADGARIAVTYRPAVRDDRAAVAASAAASPAASRDGIAGGQATRLVVDAVVNCTGPDPAPGADGDPLLSALVADGLGRAGPLGLGLDTGPDGELLDCDGRPSPCLFTLGALRRGQLWETTAVPEIRLQAADLAALLVARGAARASALA